MAAAFSLSLAADDSVSDGVIERLLFFLDDLRCDDFFFLLLLDFLLLCLRRLLRRSSSLLLSSDSASSSLSEYRRLRLEREVSSGVNDRRRGSGEGAQIVAVLESLTRLRLNINVSPSC